MKKILSLILALVMALSLVACGKKDETPDPVEDEQKPEGTVEVVWWTNYGDKNISYLQKTIDAFNASQSDYHVTIEYQGSAAELKAKVQSTAQADLPALFNSSVQSVGICADADYCAPLQQFVDADTEGWPELDATYASLRASYTDGNGNLIGYPNGYSYGGVYYNADLLKDAGIDPASLKTVDDIYNACETLVKGGHCTYGIGFHDSGFYFNAMLGREGVKLYDAGNGYEGRVENCLYESDSTVNTAVTNLLSFYQKLYANKLAIPYGSNYQSEIIPQMASGDCAMFVGVVSMTTKLLTSIEGKFELGIMPLPSVTADGKRTGEPAGGTGIFICDNGDKWAMQGAYEFIKFMSKAEYAADFAASTGYLAPSSVAYESDVYQNYLTNVFPGVSTVYESLANSDDSARNPFVGFASEMEAANKQAVETVANDANANVADVLHTCYTDIQEAIDLYNMSNPVKD